MKTLPTTNTHHRIASLLALTAALAGCGGGTEKPSTPAPPPVPAGPLSVSFTAPAAGQNVLDLGTSTRLTMNASVSGGPVPNGTTMLLTTSPANTATLAPVSPTTVGGTASSILSGMPLGSMRVNAAVTSHSAAASADLQLYTRVAPAPLQVLVPAYFSATGATSPWATLATSAASYPNVTITAIANPHNGSLSATTKVDSDALKAITAFKAASSKTKVLGYVTTASGNGSAPSVTDVKATIDAYLSLYPDLNGFFLDNMAVGTNRLAFYMEIYNHIKAKNKLLTVAGNPGTYPDQSYASVTDMLVTYASNAAAYQSIDPQPHNTWVYNQANTAQAMLVHSAGTCTAMQAAVATANLARTNTGLVYATDQPMGSAWNALPSYWTNLLSTVDAYNQGRTQPAC